MKQFVKHAPMAVVLIAAGVTMTACGGASSGTGSSTSYVTMTGSLSSTAGRAAGVVTNPTAPVVNPAATATTVVATTAVQSGTSTAVVSGGAAVTNGQFSLQVVGGQTYTLGFYDPYGNLVGQIGTTAGAAAVTTPATTTAMPLGNLNPVATTTPGLATTGGTTGQVALLTPTGVALTSTLPAGLGDYNDDGVCDELEADRDGNGRPDKSEDRNGNGIPDTAESRSGGHVGAGGGDRPAAFDDNDNNGHADLEDFEGGSFANERGGRGHGEHDGENEGDEGGHNEGSYGGSYNEREGWEYGAVGNNGVTVTQTWGGTVSNVAVVQAGGGTGVTTPIATATTLTNAPIIPATNALGAASSFFVDAKLTDALLVANPVAALMPTVTDLVTNAVSPVAVAGAAIPVTQTAAEALLKTAASTLNGNALATMVAGSSTVTYDLSQAATTSTLPNPTAAGVTLATGDILTVTTAGSVTINGVASAQSLVLIYTMQ